MSQPPLASSSLTWWVAVMIFYKFFLSQEVDTYHMSATPIRLVFLTWPMSFVWLASLKIDWKMPIGPMHNVEVTMHLEVKRVENTSMEYDRVTGENSRRFSEATHCPLPGVPYTVLTAGQGAVQRRAWKSFTPGQLRLFHAPTRTTSSGCLISEETKACCKASYPQEGPLVSEWSLLVKLASFHQQ